MAFIVMVCIGMAYMVAVMYRYAWLRSYVVMANIVTVGADDARPLKAISVGHNYIGHN